MDNSKRLSQMDAILFALALETSLQQLRTWEGSSELRLSKLSTLERQEQRKLDKLIRDRETVKDITRRTLLKLVKEGKWSSLDKGAAILEQRAFSSRTKRINHEELLMSCAEMESKLQAKRNQCVQDLRDADQKVAILRDKMKDESLNASTRLQYTELWLNARAEELELRYSKPRPPLPNADHERRVHKELCKAYDLQIQEREKNTESWRLRYAEDTAVMDKRIKAKDEQLKAITALRIERQALFDLHEGEMRAWITFKRQRAERLEREQRRLRSATRIQAWWRGCMVRHALGPFRYLKNLKKPTSKSKKK